MNVDYMGACPPEMMGQDPGRGIPVVTVQEAKDMQKVAAEELAAAQEELKNAQTPGAIASAQNRIRNARIQMGIANSAYAAAMHTKGFVISPPGTQGEAAEMEANPGLRQPAFWEKMTWREVLPWAVAAGAVGLFAL